MNILRKDWKPVLDTQAVIHGLIFLFLEPNPDDPLNEGAYFVVQSVCLAYSVCSNRTSVVCFHGVCAYAVHTEAASVLRKDPKTFARNVDQSLRGYAVGGQSFPKNPTYS